MPMSRLESIRSHPVYQDSCQKIQDAEQDRIFCRHGMEHFLDVARIAYILVLERNLSLSRDLVYAAALLHDIGKWKQYQEGIPHELASVQIAEIILADLPEEERFSREEVLQILTAIRGHRKLQPDAEALEQILYESDKASRACYSCPSCTLCNWKTEKKNMEIKI